MSEFSKVRVDVFALADALDNERLFRRTSWRRIAEETGLSPSTLTRLRQGRRIDADAYLSLCAWLSPFTGRFAVERRATAKRSR